MKKASNSEYDKLKNRVRELEAKLEKYEDLESPAQFSSEYSSDTECDKCYKKATWVLEETSIDYPITPLCDDCHDNVLIETDKKGELRSDLKWSRIMKNYVKE